MPTEAASGAGSERYSMRCEPRSGRTATSCANYKPAFKAALSNFRIATAMLLDALAVRRKPGGDILRDFAGAFLPGDVPIRSLILFGPEALLVCADANRSLKNE